MNTAQKHKMTIEELRFQLAELADGGMDAKADHIEADRLLLKFIGDTKVTMYFIKIEKWYA